MNTKKVAIKAKPSSRSAPATKDDWVNTRQSAEAPGKMKRLTIDIPPELHGRIKASCAMRGTKMVDEIRALLEERYAGV